VQNRADSIKGLYRLPVYRQWEKCDKSDVTILKSKRWWSA